MIMSWGVSSFRVMELGSKRHLFLSNIELFPEAGNNETLMAVTSMCLIRKSWCVYVGRGLFGWGLWDVACSILKSYLKYK